MPGRFDSDARDLRVLGRKTANGYQHQKEEAREREREKARWVVVVGGACRASAAA
jgi:hypothetical protein